MRKLASQGQPGVQYGKVDLRQNPQMGEQFGVRSIPDTRIFHNGQQIGAFVGSRDRAALEKLVAVHLASVPLVGEVEPAAQSFDQNGRLLSPGEMVQPAIQPEPANRALPPGISPL